MFCNGYKTKALRTIIEEVRYIVRGYEMNGFLSIPSDTPNHKLLYQNLPSKYHQIIKENKMDMLLIRISQNDMDYLSMRVTTSESIAGRVTYIKSIYPYRVERCILTCIDKGYRMPEEVFSPRNGVWWRCDIVFVFGS